MVTFIIWAIALAPSLIIISDSWHNRGLRR